MRRLLERRGIRLTKSLGQNFLHDAHHLERITAAAELTRTDRVLEIGPGLGPLTGHLLAQADEVLAIETDVRLVKVLEERFNVTRDTQLPSILHGGGQPPHRRQGSAAEPAGNRTPGLATGLRLLHADALQLLKQERHDWSDWKVVSNLPYSVASPILVELARGPRSPQRVVATLQLEVAHRLMSDPGHKDYGILTLLVQLDFEPVRWFKIPSGCFFPQPDVDSACIVLKRRSTVLLPETLRPVYVKVVKRAFSQRRKMMLKLLKQDWNPEKLGAACEQLGLSPQIRAEAVSLEQFVELSRRLAAA